MGLLVQPIVLYVVNAVIKLHGDVWPSGRAVRLVFSIDSLTVFLGEHLTAYPAVLETMGTAWVVLLCCSPLLILTAGRTRTAVVTAFASAHAGMALTLGVGLFPLVSIAALLPYLPPTAWDAIERPWNGSVEVMRRLKAETQRRVVDVGESLAKRTGVFAGRARSQACPDVTIASATGIGPGVSVDRARVAATAQSVGRGVATAMVIAVRVWNGAALGYIETPETDAIAVSPQEARWDMFAPSPPKTDVWYVAVGRLDDEPVGVIRGGDLAWNRSQRRWRSYPSARWRKYLEVVRWGDDQQLRRHFASALCARWDASHRRQLASVTVYVMSQETRLNGEGEPTRRSSVREHECSA